MPFLERITVFPVKSLDGVEVREARVLPSAGLEHDRRWQLVDMEGRVVNAKRTPRLHAIRAKFTIEGLRSAHGGDAPEGTGPTVELAIDPVACGAGEEALMNGCTRLAPATFPLVPGSEGPCGWLSEALGLDVLLIESRSRGFPDDRDAPGPTLIAGATLREVARWFAFDVDECRRRFRVNLEIESCDPFWEDTLASPRAATLADTAGASVADLPADPYAAMPPPEPRTVRVGEIHLRATNVCRRCVVPSRDSRTGNAMGHFRDAFETRRSRSIRPDVDASSWSHWYRLAVNTLAEAGAIHQRDRVDLA